ncbi:MAG: stage III sporulation protein AA [Clostridia bacterium]|nr:stage III sporulation protein AA [Clostridia bacterium]
MLAVQKPDLKQILPYLPDAVSDIILGLNEHQLRDLQEIRLRSDRPLSLRIGGREERFALIISTEYLQQSLRLLSANSFYAMEEQLKNGFITLAGGHRAGLVGRAVLKEGKIATLTDISGINLRLARFVKGAAGEVKPYLYEKGELLSTLIVSPPGAGKTTVLRDLAYCLPHTVSVVDERGELAGSFNGRHSLPLGEGVDVLDGCPKAEGINLLLRSMGPEVILCDEIGSKADAEAILAAVASGVKIIASAHGGSVEQVIDKPDLARLLNAKVFGRLLLLGVRPRVGSLQAVYNQSLSVLYERRDE